MGEQRISDKSCQAIMLKKCSLCSSLAAEAAKMGGHPWLLSFSGMAEVLGWSERAPLVAESDRPRVLASWAPYCGGIVPCQRFIPFAAVRQLSPEEFVQVLALHLKVYCQEQAACNLIVKWQCRPCMHDNPLRA